MAKAKYNRGLMQKLRRPVFDRYEGKCCYCTEPVIFLSFIEHDDLVSEDTDWITHRSDGVETKTRKASLDHWQEVSVHGGTTIDNLVLSCVECNRKRAAQRYNGVRSPRRNCNHCGKPISRNRKHCRRCSRKSTATNKKPNTYKGKKRT